MTTDGLPLLALSTMRIRRSPFFEATRRWGAKAYTVYNHMYMPAWYEDPVADFWKIATAVTLWDVACQRQVEITGRDAWRLVRYLTPRDLSNVPVGACRYVPLVDERGGMVNDPVLLRLGEDHAWLSIADSDVLLWAKAIAHHGGFEVEVREPDVSPLQLQGPRAPEVAAVLFGEAVAGLRRFRLVETELDGIPLVVSRTGWSAEGGYEIYLRDSRFGEELWERIMEAGRPFGIAPAAPSQISRIEAGMLSYGNDMDLSTNPLELGMEAFVALEREDPFVGKEALREIAARGVRRRLRGFVIGGGPLPVFALGPFPLFAGGAPVGRITSAVHSPRLSANLGLGLVDLPHDVPGTILEAEVEGGRRPVRVVELPFVHRTPDGRILPRFPVTPP